MKGNTPAQGKVIAKVRKSSPEPMGPISIKLSTNHPRVKGIQNCSIKGPGPLQR
jgi:hypothetical protein